MRRGARKVGIGVAAVIALAARAAHGDDAPPLTGALVDPFAPAPPTAPPADPPATTPLQPGTSFLHLKSSAHVVTAGGSELDLPPGYYLDEPTWTKLDDAFKVCQDDDTRKTAENKVLRQTTESWQPGWKTLALTLAVGFAGGVYVRGKL